MLASWALSHDCEARFLIDLLGSGKTTLTLARPVLPAPGIWAPQCPLPCEALGALVTPPLGWEWDGGAAPFMGRPGACLWTPPRRPLERFLERLTHEQRGLPRLITLVADTPRAMAEAVEQAERAPDVQGLIVWWWAASDLPAAVGATSNATSLPVLAEVPVDLVFLLAPALAAAGVAALLVGPPRAASDHGRVARLWGPALLPQIEYALRLLADTSPTLPCIAAAGVASANDALRLRAAGAVAVALGPEWWAEPTLAEQVAAALAERQH